MRDAVEVAATLDGPAFDFFMHDFFHDLRVDAGLGGERGDGLRFEEVECVTDTDAIDGLDFVGHLKPPSFSMRSRRRFKRFEVCGVSPGLRMAASLIFTYSSMSCLRFSSLVMSGFLPG